MGRFIRFATLAFFALAAQSVPAATNKAPVAPSWSKLYASEGVPVNYTIPAFRDPEGGVLRYSVSGRPTWLAFNAGTRQLSGTAPYSTLAAGKSKLYYLKVIATDPLNKSTTKTLTLKLIDRVQPPPPPPPPNQVPRVVSQPATQTATQTQRFEYQVTSSVVMDPNGDRLSFQKISGPDWIQVDSTGFVSGYPPATALGTSATVIRATEPLLNWVEFTLTINVLDVNLAPQPTAGPVPMLVVNEDQQVAVGIGYFSDPDGDALSFSGGAGLPPSLHIASDGGLIGVPTQSEVGDHSFSITATDPSGLSASRTLSLRILPVNDAPMLAVSLPVELEIETYHAFSYTLPVNAFVDEEGDALTFSAGALPSWMTFDPATRTFSGTPTVFDVNSGGVRVSSFFPYAHDIHGARGDGVLHVRVFHRNRGPTVDHPIPDQSAVVGQLLVVDFRDVFTDFEGQPLVFVAVQKPDWLTLDAANFRFIGTPPALEFRPLGVKLRAVDAGLTAATDEFMVSVSMPAASGPTFHVRGTVVAQPTSAIDSDINDVNAPYAPNNRPGEEQIIRSNPVMIGGYISNRGTQIVGDRFASIGDLQDVYRMTLYKNQWLQVQLNDHGPDGDWHDRNAWVYLFDALTGEYITGSTSYGRSHEIHVPRDGEFHVAVVANTENSEPRWTNYLLTVSNDWSDIYDIASTSTDSEFVPNEVIVTLREDSTIAKNADPSSAASSLGAALKRGRSTKGPMLLDISAAVAAVRATPSGGGEWRRRALADQKLGESTATLEAIANLRRDPRVKSADPNFIVHPLAVPNDPLFDRQWDMVDIGLKSAWEVTTGSSDVVVAVVDSGFVMDHPGLVANIVPGYDMISDLDLSDDGDGIDPDPTEVRVLLYGRPSSFHGTHVGGTVGAPGNDGIGVTGVNWQVSLMPVRVLGYFGGTIYDVMQGVRYAAGLPNDSGMVPARPARVINLSLGGGGFVESSQELFTQLHDMGVFVVAAAGNRNSNQPMYPASYSGVLSVSATDSERKRTWYSNYGQYVDLSAPGGDNRADRDDDGHPDGILSTWADGFSEIPTPGYGAYQGTSMAAPHVAGVIGLMLALDGELTPDQFDADLASGLLTDDTGADGMSVRNDEFGYGGINAVKAVRRAVERGGGVVELSVVIAEPSTLVMPNTVSSGSLLLRDIGNGAGQVLAVETGAPWITLAPLSVDAQGLGTYTVTIDRTGLTSGYHRIPITFSMASGAPVVVRLTVHVSIQSDPAPNNGLHYVTIVDPVTLGAVAVSSVEAVDGVYTFDVGAVPAGEWLVIVGSDRDADAYICDPGEACGAYPTLDNRQTITVADSDVELAPFSTEYQATYRTYFMAPAMMKLAPAGVLRLVPTEGNR